MQSVSLSKILHRALDWQTLSEGSHRKDVNLIEHVVAVIIEARRICTQFESFAYGYGLMINMPS